MSTSRPAPTAEQIALVDEAIVTRRSLRAFLPTPVPRSAIEEILAVASRAPSGTNTQPWKVYVLTGNPKRIVGLEGFGLTVTEQIPLGDQAR